MPLQIPMAMQPSGSPQFAYRNNNPGNLQYARQPGATLGDGGFARVLSPEHGVNALHDQIALDQSRGLTVGQFIKKYAPPNQNDTLLYTTQAQKALGAGADDPLSTIDRKKIAAFVARKESGTDISRYAPPAPLNTSWLAKHLPQPADMTAVQPNGSLPRSMVP